MSDSTQRSTPPPVISERWKDTLFENVTRFFALLVFSILAAILVSLVIGSSLSLQKYGIPR